MLDWWLWTVYKLIQITRSGFSSSSADIWHLCWWEIACTRNVRLVVVDGYKLIQITRSGFSSSSAGS
ncbi:hypothetical protein H5410_029664 [Solanum commersonii]|uniref:Uncharacterized protein n=1 Tax=Solanum commersonii TaxID=4109 RepID=A0A9J5YH15_SOLCO|nr:hypothetical protein H5410_029664 [Solanum commersonii]